MCSRSFSFVQSFTFLLFVLGVLDEIIFTFHFLAFGSCWSHVAVTQSFRLFIVLLLWVRRFEYLIQHTFPLSVCVCTRPWSTRSISFGKWFIMTARNADVLTIIRLTVTHKYYSRTFLSQCLEFSCARGKTMTTKQKELKWKTHSHTSTPCPHLYATWSGDIMGPSARLSSGRLS